MHHFSSLLTLSLNVVLLVARANAQDFAWVGGEGGQVGGFNGQFFQECLNVAQRSTCHPFADHPVCVRLLCSQCAVYSHLITSCCKSSNDVSVVGTCLSNSASGSGSSPGSGSGSGGNPGGSAVTSVDPNFAGCQTAAAVVSSCESATPGFATMPSSAQASCVCYDTSGNYLPNVFDGAALSCYNYLATANATEAAAYNTDVVGFCTGNGAAATAVPTPTTAMSDASSGASATEGATVVTASGSTVGSAIATTAASHGEILSIPAGAAAVLTAFMLFSALSYTL